MAKVAGVHQSEAEALAKLHNDTKRIAVLMCEEMMLEPYKLVRRPAGDEKNGGVMQQWEAYYLDAKKALCGWRAVNKYIMTET